MKLTTGKNKRCCQCHRLLANKEPCITECGDFLWCTDCGPQELRERCSSIEIHIRQLQQDVYDMHKLWNEITTVGEAKARKEVQ